MMQLHLLHRRRLPALLAAVLLALTTPLTGCGEKEQDEAQGTKDPFSAIQQNQGQEDRKNSDAAAQETLSVEEYALYNIEGAETAYPDMPAVMTFKEGDTVVGTVTYDEYRYYQLLYKNYFDDGDAMYWQVNPEMEARVKRLFVDEIVRNHVVAAECARYGLALDAAEQDALHHQNAQLVADFGGKEYFDQALEQYFMTEYFYNYKTENDLLYEKLEAYYQENGQILTADADIRAMLDSDDFICCKHILIKNDPEDDVAANLVLAEELLDRLRAGEAFDTVMQSYSEDTDAAGNLNGPEGYYFFRGEMDENFENAAFALQEGEMSGLVESAYGWHIILRCAKEASYLDTNFAAIKTSYLSLRFYQVLDDVAAGWTTVTCDGYDTYADWSFAETVNP